MSQVQKYATPAQRQAAYRQRRAQAEHEREQRSGIAALPVIGNIPGTVRWRQALAGAAVYLNAVREEMSAYHSGRSERWQDSERAEVFRERLEQIEQIADLLDEVRHEL